MAYAPMVAPVIRLKLAVGQLLDDSTGLSVLSRATFRIELLTCLQEFDQGNYSVEAVTEQLRELLDRVREAANALPRKGMSVPKGSDRFDL
jgi:hypothetical protein